MPIHTLTLAACYAMNGPDIEFFSEYRKNEDFNKKRGSGAERINSSLLRDYIFKV